MNTEKDFLKVIEDLPIIYPSQKWNDDLQTKIKKATNQKNMMYSSYPIIVAFLVLVVVNVFTFTSAIEKGEQLIAFQKSKAIANEFLISTSSSKF